MANWKKIAALAVPTALVLLLLTKWWRRPSEEEAEPLEDTPSPSAAPSPAAVNFDELFQDEANRKAAASAMGKLGRGRKKKAAAPEAVAASS